MNRRWLWGGLGLIAVAAVIAFQMHRQVSEPVATSSVVPSSSSPRLGAPIEPDSLKPADENEPAVPAARAGDPANTTEFKEWLKKESAALNAISVDSDRKHSELKEKAARLTPVESNMLLQTARQVTAPSAEKILSAFLLVEGGLNTRRELAELIASPLNTNPATEAHSQEEMVSTREKSLRVMAIDGLLSQAKTDPSAKALLVKKIPDIEDPYIRDYARRRLQELERQ